MIFRRYLLAVIYVIILTLIVYILQQDGAGIISAIKLKYTGITKGIYMIIKAESMPELSLSLSAILHDKKNQATLDRIMQKNVSSLTESNLAQFYSIKEAQYEARRQIDSQL